MDLLGLLFEMMQPYEDYPLIAAVMSLLYEACDRNDSFLMRRLVKYGKALGSMLFGQESLWCRQDSQQDTILHRALKKKHEFAIVEVILSVDPLLSSVKNGSGWLPVEVVLKDEEERGGVLCNELLDFLFEKMQPYEQDTSISASSSLLYHACDMNDVVLVRRLSEYIASHSSLSIQGQWSQQDSQGDTILHRAVKKKFDLAVIQAILKADPSTCIVRNGSDLLAVEGVLKGKTENGKFLYQELPSDLLDLLFETMQPYEQDPAIATVTSILYRACDLNDEFLVNRLMEYWTSLKSRQVPFGVGESSSQHNSILHRAVKKKYALAVIKVILKADPSACSVMNGSGWLPVEVVLKGEDNESGLLYKELPLDLLDLLFEKMQPYEKDPKIDAVASLLYFACDLNDVVLVRRLFEYAVARHSQIFQPSSPDSLWCRQDSRQDTILHRALIKKYNIEILKVIVKGDASVCTVRSGSGWLPVEVVLNGQEEGGGFLYKELPAELLDMLFKIMQPYEKEPAIPASTSLLYRACDLNDVPLVQRLLAYGAVLSPPPGLLNIGPGLWSRQDSQGDTILHRAAKKKFDLAVIQVILKADPSTCRVRNRSGWLPVEVVLKARGGSDGGPSYLYEEELPLALLGMLLEKMRPYDIDQAIAACSSPEPSSRQRYADFRILARSLQQVRAVRSINVHLLGHGCAGKSTLRSAFRHTLPNPSRLFGHVAAIFGYKQYADPIAIENRTIGCEVETIEYNNQHWRFFDYGGQEKFHANHDRFLRLSDSLYIIVVPLFDFLKKEELSLDRIRERYAYWLRFLASITLEDDSVAEIFTVMNGRKLIKAHVIDSARECIRTEQEKWVYHGRAFSKDQQEPPLLSGEKPRLRFVDVDIPCVDNNRLNEVRDVLNDVMVQTIARVQREATMYPKLLSKYEDLKNEKRANKEVFLTVVDFKAEWIGPAVNKMGGEMSLSLKEYLMEWMLQRLQDMKEIIIVNGCWVLLDDTWLTKNVLGNIINKSEKKNKDYKCLLTAEYVKALIDSEVMNNPKDVQLQTLQKAITMDSLAALLESIGACVRVKTLAPDTFEHQGRGFGKVSGGEEQLLLFFPMVKFLELSAKKISNMESKESGEHWQQIQRMFKLVERHFTTFPPGYFERLFTEIVSLFTQQNRSIYVDTYENALVVRTQGFSDVEVIVKVEGDEFTVTVTTLTRGNDSVNCMALESYAEARLASICNIVRSKEYPAITEFCSHPIYSMSMPLREVVEHLHDKSYRQMFYGVTYFNSAQLQIEELTATIRRSTDTLRRAIQEVKDVKCPYCFVLTDVKLGPSSDQRASISKTLFQCLRSAVYQISPTRTTDEPELWFYLLDQHSMEPIVLAADDPNSDRYPIRISRPSEFIQRWLPLVTTTLSVMKGVNGIAGIARLLGYPVPDLADFLSVADSYLKKIDDNARLNATMVAGSRQENASKTFFRGFKLRDLEAFYESNNCKDIAYICKLYPVMDTDGYRCWTIEEHKDKLFHQDIPHHVPAITFAKGPQAVELKDPIPATLVADDGVHNGSTGKLSTSAVDDLTRMEPKFEVECFIWRTKWSSKWTWSKRKKNIKLEDGQLIHWKSSKTVNSFSMASCYRLTNQELKPTIADRPPLPFQLRVQGYDRPPPSRSLIAFIRGKKRQETQMEMVLGFESEEECAAVAAAVIARIIKPDET